MSKTASRLAKHPPDSPLTVVRPLPEEEPRPEASPPESPQAAAPAKEEPERLTLKVGAYIALVALAAAFCVAFFAIDFSTAGWPGFLTLAVLAVAFERFGIKIYGDTQVSVGVVALFAIGILYGAPGVAIAAPVVVFAATAHTPSKWYQRLFDMGSYTLANVSAALVFHALIDTDVHVTAWWVPAALLATVVNYGVNIPLVVSVVSLSSGERWLAVWRDEHQWIIPYYVVFGMLGLALATAYEALGMAGIFAFVAPPLMMRFALHQYVTKTEENVLELKQTNSELQEANRSIIQMANKLTETYDGTLEALVLALDARDRETHGHSFRVANYVMAMARKLGVEEGSQDWVDMYRGGLLHDVGKIGIRDFILHKPGPLTPEEWDDMKRHPGIGYDMLHEISFLSGAAEIVRCHHERFDGKGYPRGMRGDEIPLGARIFAAADAFDAMTADRPYRKALHPDMARDEIVRHSGTQFDPEIVQAFLLIYDELEMKALTEREPEHHLRAA